MFSAILVKRVRGDSEQHGGHHHHHPGEQHGEQHHHQPGDEHTGGGEISIRIPRETNKSFLLFAKTAIKITQPSL